MILISITPEMLAEAKSEQRRRMSFGFRGPIKDNEYKSSKIYISCIGELVFRKFLSENRISFSNINNDSLGRTLVIDGKVFETKTSGYDKSFSRLNLLYNTTEYEESNSKGIKYVVQIFINGLNFEKKHIDDSMCNLGTIIGYIHFEDIDKYSVVENIHRPNYKVGLNHLRDIKEILPIL